LKRNGGDEIVEKEGITLEKKRIKKMKNWVILVKKRWRKRKGMK
jgi:hypothetical protein